MYLLMAVQALLPNDSLIRPAIFGYAGSAIHAAWMEVCSVALLA